MSQSFEPDDIERSHDLIEFQIWYQNGVNRGWVSPMVCLFHDGVGLTGAEMMAAEMDLEPCVWVMRRYASADERFEVEDCHPPSLWRNGGHAPRE